MLLDPRLLVDMPFFNAMALNKKLHLKQVVKTTGPFVSAFVEICHLRCQRNDKKQPHSSHSGGPGDASHCHSQMASDEAS